MVCPHICALALHWWQKISQVKVFKNIAVCMHFILNWVKIRDLAQPNLQRYTRFDMLIIFGVKFWWFSFFLEPLLPIWKPSYRRLKIGKKLATGWCNLWANGEKLLQQQRCKKCLDWYSRSLCQILYQKKLARLSKCISWNNEIKSVILYCLNDHVWIGLNHFPDIHRWQIADSRINHLCSYWHKIIFRIPAIAKEGKLW